MTILQTFLLSFVEGVSEFLPISSTGHLILASQILKIEQTQFVKSFEIIIQFGAILGVVVLYFRTLTNTKLWPKIVLAFLPSAFVGFIFYKFIKDILIGNSLITVIALLLGGFAFIAIEHWNKNKSHISGLEKITLKNALIIGIFQSVSVIPGVSRAGATILGALLLKTERKTAAEFSFILAVPTMLGATLLDIFETKLAFSKSELSLLLVGFILSFIFAMIAVKFFIRYLGNHSFTAFGVYRIIAAIVFWLFYLR
ncbi:MAG: undecaprenyl-diphosphate phosphatase [Candidatus Levybacteria bacterium]|nr:undecaprenyl-diphosphate phosphatase [Candidatus Levybacteria bacterium]